MSKNNWGFTMPESVLKTERMLDKLRLSVPSVEISKALQAAMPTSFFKTQGILDQLSIPALEFSDALKVAIPEYNFSGISEALRESAAVFQELPKVAFPTDTLWELAGTMQTLPQIEVSGLAQAILSQIDSSAYVALKESATMVSLATADWSWLSEGYNKEGETEEEAEDVQGEIAEEIVTPEIRAEIREDVAKVMINPEQAAEISSSNYLKWKERHPFLADLYMQVFLTFIASVLCWLFTSGVEAIMASATKNARVYDEPFATANVVCNVTVKQNITVIGEAPYYYVVELPNSEAGEKIVGYIYKGNLTIEKSDISEEDNREATVAEDSEKIEPEVEETEFVGELETTIEVIESPMENYE